MSTAKVISTDAPRQFRAALVRFVADVEAALVAMEIEAHKPLDWVEANRPQYWRQAARKASEQLAEARVALEKCQVRVSSEDARYCYEERKALEKAKRRLQMAEDKVQSLRRWRVEIQKAVEELQVQIGRAKHYSETDIAKAIAALDRITAALDRYTEQSSSPPTV